MEGIEVGSYWEEGNGEMKDLHSCTAAYLWGY